MIWYDINMKKFAALILFSFLSFFGAEPVFSLNNEWDSIYSESIIYSESSFKIHAIDPLKPDNINSYYPGMRGPNQLIVYTPKYGFRTGTNEYGTEAVIVNNTAVQLNGADTVIPYRGFVVSGHGKAKQWIMQNIQLGAKVYIDYKNSVIKCFITPESLLYGAKEKIKEVNSILEYYRRMDILYNDKKASELLENSKDLLRKIENYPDKTPSLISEAVKSSEEALKNAIPYSISELKGIWVRPVEDTPDKIEKTVSRMNAAGITDIFLETFFHGKTIYYSNFLKQQGVIPQHEAFQGFDPLEVWIKEAHRRGMKLHIWFECFYLGNDKPKDFPNHILNVHPEWSNKRFTSYESSEPAVSVSEHNGYFLDPADIRVRVFLLGIIKEIMEKYKPDGINLDYLRYPQSADTSYANYAMTNWGYTETARREFKILYGKDPVEISYGSPEWELWNLYRQDKITNFTRDVKMLAVQNNTVVTAVIFPDLKKSAETKMQNWQSWADKNYVDGFTPLILTGDKNTAVKILQEIKSCISPSVKVYPGVFSPFMNAGFEDLLMLIQKIREFNFHGAVLFDYAHLSSESIDALKTRIFNDSYEDEKRCRQLKNKKLKEEKKRKKKERARIEKERKKLEKEKKKREKELKKREKKQKEKEKKRIEKEKKEKEKQEQQKNVQS